jgi:hypothetical protein
VQPLIAAAQLVTDEPRADVGEVEVVPACRGADDSVEQVDALVDLGSGRGAEPDAEVDAELVEDGVVDHHHTGVRRMGGDRAVRAVQPGRQLGAGDVLRLRHRSHAA